MMNLVIVSYVIVIVTSMCTPAFSYQRNENDTYFAEAERVKRSLAGDAVALLLRGTKKIGSKSRADVESGYETMIHRYRKSGGYRRALREFNAINPSEVKPFVGKGKMGTIGDRNIFLFPQHHDDPAVIVILDRKPTVVVDIVIDYFLRLRGRLMNLVIDSDVVLVVISTCLAVALSYPQNQISNYFGEERTRRSLPGEAVKLLLRGARRIREQDGVIWYQKSGDYARALDDFMKTQPSGVKSFARGTGQIGRIGNRHIFVIRKNQASGIVGVTDDTAHFQWKDIYIEYSP